MNRRCFFRRFTVGRYPINGYLIADRASGIGVFIDPGGWDETIASYITSKDIQLRDIFFTHGDWDHIEGIGDFKKRYSVRSYAGKDEVAAANYILHGGETLEVGKLSFEVFSTPGHTPAGLSFYCRAIGMLFPGDALFCGSMGGTRQVALAQQQTTAVRKYLFALPDETRVCPGHGPMTTIAAEKYHNPFCAAGLKE